MWDLLVDWVEWYELIIEKHARNAIIPFAGIHTFDPSHGMYWQEDMSWYSIDGM